MVNPSGSTYSYFMSTLDPVAQALVPKMLLLDNSDQGTPSVRWESRAGAAAQPALSKPDVQARLRWPTTTPWPT